ncbi:MAG: capsular polysaccharide biosynthesis protein [Akkermansiaceae bacterium]
MKGIHHHPLVRIHRNALNRSVKYGWGYRPSGLRARKSGGDYLLYEDAPVRSLKPGYGGGIYGITADAQGAMFDASGQSDLIDALQGEVEVDDAAPGIMERYRTCGISKYNWSMLADLSAYEEGVLLVDQSRGDASMKYGGLDITDLSRLFDDALTENPESVIYIKTHPDRYFRRKKSCFSERQLSHPRVQLLSTDLSPADCFKFCSIVYVGTSLMGMEALIHGCEVVTYGWNFYAGWGLTTDRGRAPLPPRARQHSVIELFQACYIDYSHYYDPDMLEECDLSSIIDHIALQKPHWEMCRGSWSLAHLNPWQRYVLPRFIKGPQTKLSTNGPADYELAWGINKDPEKSKSSGSNIIHVEDGFIRSKGLGANFHLPLSLVFDVIGIYYDARSPSRLEQNLNSAQYSPEQLSEARELSQFLCDNKITKYQLGIEDVKLPAEAAGKKVILVPGQVDSDASIKYGSPKLKNNKELLEEVRAQQPDAYICYKPHPDLLSGARPDKPLWPGIENQVDHLVEQGDIISWIEAVDEVHTLTSTVGFEALMRNKPVFTYGLPFYAGWGLTEDWLSCERRTATRTLEELVYAVLIEYPTYLNPKTGEFTTALNAAKLLADPDFSYDARPLHIKLLAPLKSIYNRCIKRRLTA